MSGGLLLVSSGGVGLALALATVVAAVGTQAAQTANALDVLLKAQRFSAADRQALEAEKAVVKSLDTPVRREVAHFGVVHINTSADHFVDRFRDIERFERGPGIPQIGRLSVPPRPEELQAMKLPARDIAALAKCHPGDCEVKLSTAAITRFRQEVNWSSPNASLQAQEVARAMLLDLVRAYQANGDAALGRYDDREEPLPIAEEFRALLAGTRNLPVPVPELMAYLEAYPRHPPAGSESFFYWSMVDFGLKPTVRVNHVVIYPLASRPSGVSHVIAIKQLYASHYFQTTLELRFLMEDGRSPAGKGTHLVSLTRSRIDGTGGLTGALLRSVVNRRSRTAVHNYLEHLKRQVEDDETQATRPRDKSSDDVPPMGRDFLTILARARLGCRSRAVTP